MEFSSATGLQTQVGVLLNDRSVLLNLLAADCLTDITAVTDWQFAICPAVRDEAKRLRGPQTGEMKEVDFTPQIESGVLQVLDFSGDEEKNLGWAARRAPQELVSSQAKR